MAGVELGYQVCKGSKCQSGFGTIGGKSSAGWVPVQPLASSPKPWRNMTDAGEAEGLMAGIIMGGSLDMIWKKGSCGWCLHILGWDLGYQSLKTAPTAWRP